MGALPPNSLASLGANGASLRTPGADPLTLGPLTFFSIEAPNNLPIGGVEHKLVVKEKIGGGRSVQKLGAQPKAFSFKGTLYQPSLDQQILDLTALAAQGTEVLISWRKQSWYGIVKDSQPTYQHANRAEYEVQFEPTRDNNGALSTPVPPVSVDTQAGTLASNAVAQGQALALSDPAAGANISALVSALAATIASAMPISSLVGVGATNLINSITSVIGSVTGYQGLQIDGSTNWLIASQILSTLTVLQMNVSNGQGNTAKTVQAQSMFELASMQYGDPSIGISLAQANGFDSPWGARGKSNLVVFPPLSS